MSAEEQAVSTEEKHEEAAKEVVSRETIIEKVGLRKEAEAIKDLIDYVDAKVQELLEKTICPIGEKMETHAELLKMLKMDMEALRLVVPMVEFSSEDRAVIIEAFKKVHTELGAALSTLASKDIAYRSLFDSKHGLLNVRLWKVIDNP